MATYKLKTNKEEDFEELAKIAFNLRHFSKIWKEHFGANNRINMAYWESKMDKFLSESVELIPDEETVPDTVEKWDFKPKPHKDYKKAV